MPEWDGLLPPVSCGERPIIDGVRTPVAYSTACSRDKTRKAEQWESTQQGFENGEEREALLARPRLIIDGVLRDSATSEECSVYRAISL